MIVLDASIARKLFRPDEPDADRVRQLIEDIADGRLQVLAPGILLYETLAAAQGDRLRIGSATVEVDANRVIAKMAIPTPPP